jgi:hypothetical protein
MRPIGASKVGEGFRAGNRRPRLLSRAVPSARISTSNWAFGASSREAAGKLHRVAAVANFAAIWLYPIFLPAAAVTSRETNRYRTSRKLGDSRCGVGCHPERRLPNRPCHRIQQDSLDRSSDRFRSAASCRSWTPGYQRKCRLPMIFYSE